MDRLMNEIDFITDYLKLHEIQSKNVVAYKYKSTENEVACLDGFVFIYKALVEKETIGGTEMVDGYEVMTCNDNGDEPELVFQCQSIELAIKAALKVAICNRIDRSFLMEK